MNFNVKAECDFNTKPDGISSGTYYIMKKNVINRFSFSSENEGVKAFSDMQEFFNSRKDRSQLRVQLV